jgi:predicted amidophosphoribosyltransferase
MSYEHCEIHDCDATNGCDRCAQDQRRRDADGICFACGRAIPRGELRCSVCGVDLKIVIASVLRAE